MKTKVRILIFEDDKLSQLSTQMELQERQDIEIQRLDCYDQYNDAAYATTSKKYTMAIIDLMIGQSLEGLRFAKLCLKRNIFPIILTNIGDAHILQDLYDSGINNIFLKSDRDAVNKAIKAYIEYSKKNRKEQFFVEKFYTTHAQLKKNILKIIDKKDLLGETIMIYGAPNTGKSYLGTQIIDFFYSMKSEIHTYLLDASSSHTSQAIRTAVEQNKNIIILIYNFDQRNTTQDSFLESCFDKDNIGIILTSNSPVLNVMNGDHNSNIVNKILESYKIPVPTLLERKEDIIPLLEILSQKELKLSDETLNIIMKHNWQNNLADLKATGQYFQEKKIGRTIINKKDLPEDIFFKNEFAHNEFLTEYIINCVDKNGLLPVLKDIKKEIIIHYFNKNGQKYRETAKELNISTSVLYNTLK